jgi:hypothetical protein
VEYFVTKDLENTGWGRETGDFKNSVIKKEFVFAKLQICHLKVHSMPFIS